MHVGFVQNPILGMLNITWKSICWRLYPQPVGGLENVLFSIIYGLSSFPLTNSYFSQGLLNHQPANIWVMWKIRTFTNPCWISDMIFQSWNIGEPGKNNHQLAGTVPVSLQRLTMWFSATMNVDHEFWTGNLDVFPHGSLKDQEQSFFSWQTNWQSCVCPILWAQGVRSWNLLTFWHSSQQCRPVDATFMSQNFGFEHKKHGASALASFGNWQKEFYAQVGSSLPLGNVSIAWSAVRNHNCNNFISLKDLVWKEKSN